MCPAEGSTATGSTQGTQQEVGALGAVDCMVREGFRHAQVSIRWLPRPSLTLWPVLYAYRSCGFIQRAAKTAGFCSRFSTRTRATRS
jgi:hypothetical protein